MEMKGRTGSRRDFGMAHDDAVEEGKCDERILILPEFVPCQKRLSETEIAFVIFPSNRGGYCIQPQKKEFSMNYKCAFPEAWLGLGGRSITESNRTFRSRILS